MAYRSEIERALAEMASDEGGMKFQGLAVINARQKWPQLVACERKWDGGLDAHADGALDPEGKGVGLASSLTATLKKIKSDAEKVKENYPDVSVLIFATAGEVTGHTAGLWATEIFNEFGLKLVVVPREEFITWLMDPANSNICRDQLGIAPSMPPELEPALKRSQEAAKELADNWDRTFRKAGRPLINLNAVKLDERGTPVEAVSLRTLLTEGQRIILEAPAGGGKTTTLVQLAQHALAAAGLALLVDLPEWIRSNKSLLSFVAKRRQFASRDVDANLLSKLRGQPPLTILLNGWNEVSVAGAVAADTALRELDRDFPAAIIIVATRRHRLTPQLRNAFRVALNSLGRAQRNEYLGLAIGASAHDLGVKLDSSRVLDSITRTPLILAEVVDLYRSGKEIPATKMGVLGAVMDAMEQSPEHRTSLQQAPLRGHAAEYLRALSMEMTERGETNITAADAQAIVNAVSAGLQGAGKIASVPDPVEILEELSKRHVLLQAHADEISFRFQHQQFQEFFAAGGLKSLLVDLVGGKHPEDDRIFLASYVNEPRWGESLRMLAEDIGAPGGEKKMVEVGAKLVRMALEVDPIFAGELARWCGPAIWSEVRNEVGVLLRAWYSVPDANHKHCALAAMLATGSDDFQDLLVPLLTDGNNQVRLSVYHGGVEVLPSSLGPKWRDVIHGWPEEARLDLIGEMSRDPWLADTVEEIALADPSPKIRWSVARVLSWYGFTEKVERLLNSLDDGSLRIGLRTSQPDDIPLSLWPRVVGVYEQMFAEESDPLERVRLLRVLQGFGGTNVVERLEAELDGLGPDELKAENHGQITGALEELQKSDANWVSEWVARKVLDRSTWFGGWQGLVTRIPDEERDSLYARFSTEVLDSGEQPRVLSVLASVTDEAFASRVFASASELRRGLSFQPGQDMPKWNLFRQLGDLLKTVSPSTFLDGISEKLQKEPDIVELEVLTDVLPAMHPTKADVRSSISEEMRLKLRAYLKRGAELGADPDGLRASTRAYLARLLANVGEREDLADIRRLVEADSIRFQRAQESRLKGDRSHDETGYGLFYFDAVTMVDPVAADQVLVELIGTQEYEWVLAQRLPLLARRSTGQPGFGTNRMDFGKIWKLRAGEPDDSFVEKRRSRFADAIRTGIERIQREREGAADKRGFDHRLKILAGTLAALDGKRSAKLVLELMELPGRWDGWTRVGALENLLVSGVRLSLEEVLRILDPVMQELQASGMHNDNQNVWLFARCLCVMAFVDPPAEGVAKIRELISSFRFPAHELGIVVAALGASRCDDAIDVLMEFAGPDGKGVDPIGAETWIEAIGALRGPRSNEILLSFVNPDAKLFTREFIPDHRHGDLLARLLAERAEVDGAVKAELVRLANGDLSPLKRMLLAKVFAGFRREEDLVAGLSILRDDGTGVPYELFRSMESAFLEHRPYGSGGNTFTLVPRGSNAVRKRLFEMSQNDPLRKLSAFALLGQIEVWRLEYGRPTDEPRHPEVESDISWPPFPS